MKIPATTMNMLLGIKSKKFLMILAPQCRGILSINGILNSIMSILNKESEARRQVKHQNFIFQTNLNKTCLLTSTVFNTKNNEDERLRKWRQEKQNVFLLGMKSI